jgi:hypothetical protein
MTESSSSLPSVIRRAEALLKLEDWQLSLEGHEYTRDVVRDLLSLLIGSSRSAQEEDTTKEQEP